MAITNQTLAKTLEILDKSSKQIRVSAVLEHFPLFMAYYGREYIKSAFADFHFDFMEDVQTLSEKVPTEILWCAFRESAKTSIAKWAVVWLIVSRKKKNIAILSYRDSNASQFALDVAKELAENLLIKRDFGVIYTKSREGTEITKKTAKEFECKGGVWLQAATVGIDPRGLLKGAQRPDFVILDDFENNDTVGSKVETESIRNQITSILGGIDFESGSVLYLGNYLSSVGNVAWVKNKLETSGKTVRFIPAINNDKPSWARFTIEKLEEKRKSLGSRMFDTEYMLIPISDLNKAFKREQFRYITWQELNMKETKCYITIDPAYTKTERSDYTGITINFVCNEGKWHVKAYQKKLLPNEIIDELFELYTRYSPRKMCIEDFAYTAGLKPAIDQRMREKNIYLPLITTKAKELATSIGSSSSNKEQRIETSLSPLYESGTIYHIIGECEDLEDQLLRHPLNDHDDIIDSLAYQRGVVDQVGSGAVVTSYTPDYQYGTNYTI